MGVCRLVQHIVEDVHHRVHVGAYDKADQSWQYYEKLAFCLAKEYPIDGRINCENGDDVATKFGKFAVILHAAANAFDYVKEITSNSPRKPVRKKPFVCCIRFSSWCHLRWRWTCISISVVIIMLISNYFEHLHAVVGEGQSNRACACACVKKNARDDWVRNFFYHIK